MRGDPEWLAGAEEYRKAEAVVAEWAKKLEGARLALVTLMHNVARVEGGGIIATRYARQGAVDYKAIVQERLPGVDVRPYRRPGGEQVRITISERDGASPRPATRAAETVRETAPGGQIRADAPLTTASTFGPSAA